MKMVSQRVHTETLEHWRRRTLSLRNFRRGSSFLRAPDSTPNTLSPGLEKGQTERGEEQGEAQGVARGWIKRDEALAFASRDGDRVQIRHILSYI